MLLPELLFTLLHALALCRRSVKALPKTRVFCAKIFLRLFELTNAKLQVGYCARRIFSLKLDRLACVTFRFRELGVGAEELSLELGTFDACREGEDARREVEADIRDARSAGASGTPAFFVNGILLSGAQPLEAFAGVIDRELARLGAPAP